MILLTSETNKKKAANRWNATPIGGNSDQKIGFLKKLHLLRRLAFILVNFFLEFSVDVSEAASEPVDTMEIMAILSWLKSSLLTLDLSKFFPRTNESCE